LNVLLDNIIKSSEKGKDETCSNYIVVLESSLKKHLKVDLAKLNDSIYLLPKEDVARVKNVDYKKEDLCKLISSHYKKIIKLVKIIREVYDLENEGKYSIAGICMSNISIKDDVLKVNYCGNKQKDNEGGTVDFSKLKGLKLFCETLLDNEEKNIMLNNIDRLLKFENVKNFNKCSDKLLTNKEYLDILSTKTNQCVVYKNLEKNNYLFTVSKKNLIISDELCNYNLSHSVSLVNKKDEKVKKTLFLYNKLNKNYDTNMNNILKIVFSIVDMDANKNISIKSLSNTEIDNLEKECKKNISKFYLQTIADTQLLVSYVLSSNKK
jgi:hypothetical protein